MGQITVFSGSRGRSPCQRDVPAEHGPPKPIYNRFIRWSRMGVFNPIFAALAAKRPEGRIS